MFGKWIKKEYAIAVVSLIIVGSFLRFYHFEQFVTFLADQGRDAIIAKRIITFEHLTAIGPSTSIGHVFLGPFYYYFIAPWLLLTNFEPVGLAIGVAFFAILYILINFFIVKQFLGNKIALISSLLITFSTTMIDFSRFSWNPNPLPLFTLITFYFFIKAMTSQKYYYFVAFGFFLSFSIQLHYLALFLIPPCGIYMIFSFFKYKEKSLRLLFGGVMSAIAFFIGISPLILFDLKHNFINSKSFITLFSNSNQIITNRIQNFMESFNFLNQYTFNMQTSLLISTIFFLLLIVFITVKIISTKKKQTSPINIFTFFFIFSLLGVAIYPGAKHAHYFAIVFPFYFIILSWLITQITNYRFGNFIRIILIIFFVILNIRGYRFMDSNQYNQIFHARTVAAYLNTAIGNESFNFAVQPDGWQEDAYLYFLEIHGKRPADREKNEVTNQMFVVCGDPCNLYQTKSWNVTMFGKFKIINQKKVEGVDVYKLIHST